MKNCPPVYLVDNKLFKSEFQINKRCNQESRLFYVSIYIMYQYLHFNKFYFLICILKYNKIK